ncbi:hypothetical protein [Actinomyces procaprae]|uniref:hypothetical protein n=1 Tax=Actinomyces procaprae TaxID=2560010 RepID=UPI00109E00AA|nr:hypothetical protein [Actinomyces procaprae]
MTTTSHASVALPAVITPPAGNDSGNSQDSRTANTEPTNRYGRQTTIYDFLPDPATEGDKS